MSDTATITQVKQEIAVPRMYSVVVHNDDFTPMEFVVKVLETVFRKSEAESYEIMLSIHHKGKAKIGLYTRDVANTKVAQIQRMAAEEQHPLLSTVEES